MHTQHQCPAVPRALQRLPLTAHPTGSPRESSGTPSSPWPQPWPGWSATTSRSLRFQTRSARVCLLRPNRSLGLGVPWAWEWSYQRERPSPGPARKAQPRVGSLGPGRLRHRSGQSSRLLCFFPEETSAPGEGLGPAGCGGGGDRYRFEQHPQPQNPPAFPTAYGRRTAGLGLGLRNLPSPGLSRSLWVLNAKDWGRASISPWALTGAT